MKSTYLLAGFALALLLSGCAAVYQTEQTPDDLYYSPTTVTPKERDVVANNNDNDARYEEYISSSDDRYLRMKVTNRNRWNAIDDYSYWNDSRFDFYGYNYYSNFYGNSYYNNWSFYPGFNFGYNNFYSYGYNPYSFGYNNNYNPYYSYYGGYYNPHGYGYGSGYGIQNNAGPRKYSSGSNVASYRNNNYNNSNTAQPSRSNNSNGNSFGNLMRRVIAPPANSPSGTPSTTVDRPARTFSPSGQAPSSNTGGSSGGFGSTGSSSDAPRKPRG